MRPHSITSKEISIHALREEGDNRNYVAPRLTELFLSTPSARRATGSRPPAAPPSSNFYPRPPRGGRQYRLLSGTLTFKFLSTPSARRATVADRHLARGRDISIHALREEGDPLRWCRRCPAKYFYPRPPRGGRPSSGLRGCSSRRISIHALREEGDSKNRDKISIFKQIIQHSARI